MDPLRFLPFYIGVCVHSIEFNCFLQGLFKESTMRLIPAFEASPKGYADLYQTVLVDTPIGPYFSQFLEQQQERLQNAAQVCENKLY